MDLVSDSDGDEEQDNPEEELPLEQEEDEEEEQEQEQEQEEEEEEEEQQRTQRPKRKQQDDDDDDNDNENANENEEEEEEDEEERARNNASDNQGSDFEYSSSEHDEQESDDSYVYPFSTSTDDSWASLDSDACLQKILAKLPTYDPPDSNEDANKSGSPSPSQYSDHGNDSVVENEDTKLDSTTTLEKFMIDKCLDIMEKFEMVVDYDADEENETDVEKDTSQPSVKPKVKSNLDIDTKTRSDKVLAQAMTIPAATPSPIPSDDENVDIETSLSKLTSTPTTTTTTTTTTTITAKTNGIQKTKSVVEQDSGNDLGQIQGKLFEDDKEQQPPPPKEKIPQLAPANKLTLKDTQSASSATNIKKPLRQASLEASTPRKTVEKSSKSAASTPRRSIPSSPASTSKSPKAQTNVNKSNPSPRTSKDQQQRKTRVSGTANLGVDASEEPIILPKRNSDITSPRDDQPVKARRAKTEFGVNLKEEDLPERNDDPTAQKKSNRHRTRQHKKGKKIIVGDKVMVKGKGTAIIRYLGRAEHNPKEAIYGVELLDANAIGEHNGTVDGKEYFKCPEQKGLLITKKDLKPARDIPIHNDQKFNKGRNNALLFGDIVSALFGERLRVARVENDRRVKKLGPREIGRILGWRGGDDEYGVNIANNQPGFLEERFNKRNKHEDEELRKEKKLGPRDIGTARGWKGGKYDLTESENRGLFDERLTLKKRHSEGNLGTEKKLGPRDIGVAQGWKGADYKLDEQRNADLFEERTYRAKSKEDEQSLQRKEGPRDYQKSTTWKAAEYDVNEKNNGFLDERPLAVKKISKKKSATPVSEEEAQEETVERKLGPRDIGKNRYHRPDWDKQKSEDNIYTNEQKEPVARERKLGPRDYGKNKNFRAPDYDVNQNTGGFLEERVSKRKDASTKVEKKAGPRDIGKSTYHSPDWDKNKGN